MVVDGRKSFICTAIVIGLVAILTGLFVGGNLLPSRAADQLYDERVTTTTETKVLGHSHDDLLPHTHNITTVITTTETTPHGYFHDFSAAMASGPASSGTGASIPKPAEGEVWILNREMIPQTITVTAGTKVTWINKDTEEHSVTSDNGIFGMEFGPGGTFSYVFTEPGTFPYHCEPHPTIVGKVIVK